MVEENQTTGYPALTTMIMNKNYFELFGIEEKFPLDPKELEKKYFTLQREYHPDRFVAKKEKLTAAYNSALVNDAYAILKNPLNRAEYLLSLHGLKVNVESGGEKPEQKILIEAMEMREKLSETEDAQDITKLEEINQKNIQECLESIERAFDSNNFRIAAQYTIRLGYLKKFSDEIRNKKVNK